MKKLICAAAIVAVGIISPLGFVGCTAGSATVEYTLSEDGTYYVVSGVSGDKRALTEYEIPAEYSAKEGGEPLPVKEIGKGAFMQCGSLISVTIPDSVTTIDSSAFGMCVCLTEITIPASVTTIESHAFAYCTGLEKVYVYAAITVLEEKVFYNSAPSQGGNIYTNTSLKEVYLPATLQKIHKSALYGNYITDIYFAGTEAQWDELYFYETALKDGSENEYEEKTVEKDKVMPDGVKVHYNADF